MAQERNEAAEVAGMLNQICNAAIAVLVPGGDAALRSVLAEELEELRAGLGGAASVQDFLQLIIEWLRGRRPLAERLEQLEPPFRRALQAMLDQVPEGSDSGASLPGSAEGLAELLAQTVAAVVAAIQQGQRESYPALAAHLLNVGQQLPAEAQPLVENLRALLAGAEPERLAPVKGEPYAQLWSSVRLLLAEPAELGEATRAALLDRLVHNTFFALRAQSPELTRALAASLLDLQRQAVTAGQSELADFILALRLRLEGRPADALVARLTAPYTAAWQRLQP